MRARVIAVLGFLACSGCGPDFEETTPVTGDRHGAQVDQTRLGPLDPDEQIYSPPRRAVVLPPPYVRGAELVAAERAKLPVDPTGSYRREGRWGRMKIRSSGDLWEVRIDADPAPRGQATPDRCDLVAVGTLEGSRLVARAVAPAENYERYAESIGGGQSPESHVVIDFESRAATVTDGGITIAVCPMHSDIRGRYRLTS